MITMKAVVAIAQHLASENVVVYLSRSHITQSLGGIIDLFWQHCPSNVLPIAI